MCVGERERERGFVYEDLRVFAVERDSFIKDLLSELRL